MTFDAIAITAAMTLTNCRIIALFGRAQ